MNKKNYLYINERDNRLIIAFFVIIIAINAIKLAAIYYDIGMIASIITIIVTIITPIISLIKVEKKDYTDSVELENNNVFLGPISFRDIDNNRINNNIVKHLLKREVHRKEITNKIDNIFKNYSDKTKIMILTGDSGSGKSILIHMLKSDLEKKDYNVYIKRDEHNLFNDEKIRSSQKRTIVFIDHFEKALNYPSYINYIKEYSEYHNVLFILAFPQNILSRVTSAVIKNFGNIIRDTYVLSLNENDKKDYIAKISRFTKNTPIAVENMIRKIESNIYNDNEFNINYDHTDNKITKTVQYILCEELVRICNGQAPLIEIELLGYVLEDQLGEEKEINNKFSFVDFYLDKWVENFQHEEIAYTLLNLLAEERSYSIGDIKLATFECKEYLLPKNNEGKCGKIIAALEKNPFIHCYTGAGHIRRFEPVHNYVVGLLRTYCMNKAISKETMYYIDYLKRCIDGKDRNINEKYRHIYNNLKSRYNRYYDKKINIGIYVFYTLMCLGIFIINIYSYLYDNSPEIHVRFIATSIVDMLSVYYIYNYCIRFFKIQSGLSVKFTYWGGSAAIVATYLFHLGWGISVGAEILILAICIFCGLMNKTCQDARRQFGKDVIVFGTIGIVIISLGFLYLDIFSTNDLFISYPQIGIHLQYSYYAIFAIYVLLSVWSHINYRYMMGRIGYSNIIQDIDGENIMNSL